LKEFKNNPYEALDNLSLKYFGFQFNLLRDDAKLRKALFQTFFLIPLIAWILLGPDSTADQMAYAIMNLPNLFMGKIDLNQLFQIYNSYYGLGTHWSAAVIYSALFIGLSKHLHDKLDVKNSLNVSVTTGFVALSIACFEFYWQASYAYFQNQWWVLHFQFPQARILIQNSMFLTVGLIVVLGLNYKLYKLNVDKLTVLCFLVTIGTIALWWYYPFPVTPLTVNIQGYGLWTSSSHFPQSMYTIQQNINDGFGLMYHVNDVGVHLVNNLAKIFMTLTFYSLFKLKQK
jgi:hypothetical protein